MKNEDPQKRNDSYGITSKLNVYFNRKRLKIRIVEE